MWTTEQMLDKTKDKTATFIDTVESIGLFVRVLVSA